MAELSYLQWQSDLSLEQVFSANASFSYPTPYADGILYLTAIASEKQRQALVLRSATGDEHFLTSAPFHLSTRINEYGGRPFWLHGDEVVFANRGDQCLYRQVIDGFQASTPQVITKHDVISLQMYAEVTRLESDFYIAIIEQEVVGQENLCYLATINCADGRAAPLPVQQGADFYNNLVHDAVGKRLAWIEWNHPLMPWDNNQLWIADYRIDQGHLRLLNKRQIVLESDASFCQLCFAANGSLFFCADRQGFASDQAENYWNIYAANLADDTVSISRVTNLTQEFGYPHWQFGDTRVVQFDQHRLLAQATSSDGDSLYRIDQDTLECQMVEKTGGRYQTLAANGHGVATLIEEAANEAVKLIKFEGDRKHCIMSSQRYLCDQDISIAQHIEYSAAGGLAYGYYYAPSNKCYENSEPPPLLVMVHGGPTGHAYANYDLQKQFWTNRGFAVLDVNHRGSSGYGREYRDALLGRWGELDTRDIVDGIDHLITERLAHPQQICIRGKSAGGYAVLRALTEYPATFQAGACYYGIGNLATLAEVTHKFEKHYTDRLIDEPYDATRAQLQDSAYFQRSPINNIGQINSAMIIFQGAEDKVVPPEVAHEMVRALKQSGIPHQYVEYQDEGHGFRQIENNIDAWTRELTFYREVLANG